MAKGKFNATQRAHLDTYIPEYIAKLDGGLRGTPLTKWKQGTATKALESPAFLDLDVSQISRNAWFKVCVFSGNTTVLTLAQMIVRKFTNYFNQVYKKANPDESSPSASVKGNPLLKFSTVLTGRQLFARLMKDKVAAISKQHVADTGVNEAAAYQRVLKELWDACSPDEKADWEGKAEDECGDVATYVPSFLSVPYSPLPRRNKKEFASNIHQALRSLCQDGLLGDAEMVLFYAFRDEDSGDLLAGTQGHSLTITSFNLTTHQGSWSF